MLPKGITEESKQGAPAGRAHGLLPRGGSLSALDTLREPHGMGALARCGDHLSVLLCPLLSGPCRASRLWEQAGRLKIGITDMKCSHDRLCHKM